MNKTIFIYWDQKFINSPLVVKKCLQSWKEKNPTWNIIELDKDNLKNYVDIEKEIPNFKNKIIDKCHYADIVRLFLLEKYGGCWCDATTFCIKPLDNWLLENTSTGFFAFNKPGNDRLLSIWFLYAEKNNFIIRKWKERILKYWTNHNRINHYFRHMYLFENVYKNNKEFKEMWDLTPKISANEPHFLLSKILNKVNDQVKEHIKNKKAPLYKLTYKYNKQRYNNTCVLAYLFNLKLK